MHRDRYPQFLCVLQGFVVLQYIDKVVDVWERGCSMEACERIEHFFKCCSRCLLGIWTLFPRAPCSGSHLPVCDSPRMFQKVDSVLFAQFSPWKSEHYFYEQYLAVTACVSLSCFWKNFTYFHRDGGDGVFGGFDAFFALLQVVWS